jgi:hypothetical protein
MTRKPCPGCGKDGGGRLWRCTDELCAGCNRLMQDGRAYRELMDQAQADGEKIPVRVPADHREVPYVHHGDYGEGGPRKAFEHAFAAIIPLLGHPVAKHQYVDLGAGKVRFIPDRCKVDVGMSAGYRSALLMRPETADWLDQLFIAVYDMVQHAYKEGQKDGERFVWQLASGDISLDELNAHEAKLSRNPPDRKWKCPTKRSAQKKTRKKAKKKSRSKSS